MGENEPLAAASPPPSGLFPNGLKPGKVASVTQLLDPERCAKAEDRTAQLIACIQPDTPSEDRRNAVARYVRRLITECFPRQVEVFTFGSVPLKTYLPDGDIDLTAFSRNQDVKDSWAHLVRDVLEKEEKNENAEFRVKEVQYIQAEVKIIKCLVENIVVDISFNQIGGLCTLCFLEEVDNYINQNHLFKRSIILIKAWCYYESRILGAHHGLISTYALETLVLYIFHVFNNSFSGPLEVLYRFLEFFSKFDWDNFCVSLWGPVPISSLPDITAEPPRKDVAELQVSEAFLKACSRVYAVYPAVQDIQGQPFVSKHFNVIDPLRENNNLGRSVSKGNFFRIRSAFSLGAKKLAKLFESSKQDVNHEVNNFFKNTWERHGGGHRPDAPGNDLRLLRLSDPEPQYRIEDAYNSSGSKGNANSSHRDGVLGTHNEPSRQNIYQAETMSRVTPQNQKISGNVNSSSNSYQPAVEIDSKSVSNDKLQRSLKPETVVNNFQGRHLFARTRSSPELTETYGEAPLQSRRCRAQEAGRGLIESEKVDDIKIKNRESETLSRHVRSLADSSSVRQIPSQIPSPRGVASTADASIAVASNDLASGSVNGDFSVVGAHRMRHEEQDLVNSMSSVVGHGFNGRFPLPLNFATGHLPFSIAPSILASMRYGQRNVPDIVPSNLPFTASAWAANADFQQSLVSSPFTHHFPGGLPLNTEITGEASNNDKAPAEMNLGEPGRDFLNDQEKGTHRSDLENGDYGTHHVNDKQQSSSEDNSFGPSDPRIRLRDDNLDSMQIDDGTVGSRSVSGGSPVRSKTSSESSWDGSTARGSKLAREKRNRKVVSSGHTSASSGKGKGVPEHSIQIDDDNREWIPNSSSEVAKRDLSPQSTVATLQVPRRQIHVPEPGQTNGSESIVPLTPFLVGHGMQQIGVDNSGYTFYPTGPPVPFVTMWPMHNFQAGTATSDASPSHLSVDEGVENNEACKSFVSFRVHNQSEILTSSQPSRIASSVDSVEHKPDILNGDFVSHWQNLQYGRSCQTSHSPVMYPTVVVPPAYFQGRLPWDGPGRPFAYPNIVNQLMTYGPQIVPVAPVQSVSTRPPNMYPRSGTGTYFPTPKISPRERHSSNMRRGNYGHDRNEHSNDRESNWNGGAKPRGSGRGHNRNQGEKSSPRQDRSDRQWVSSYRQESTSYSHQSQNGPIRPATSHDGAANMAYGMYRLPGIKQNSVTSEGHNIQPIMMFCPYEHNSDHNPTAEQLEFGSFGPHLNDGSLSPLGAASSPDQPSSPHLPRGK